MDPGAPDEPSREELESRVEQLEQTVSKMLPDRRGVIKGLGAAALGGAAVGASSGGASGQSAAGQVGTESEPVDVEGAQGNFDSVSTDVLNNKLSPDANPTDVANAVADINDKGYGVLELPETGKNNPLDLSDVCPLEITADDIWVIGQGPETTFLECGNNTGFLTDEPSNDKTHLYFKGFRLDGQNPFTLNYWHGEMEDVYVQADGTDVAIDCTAAYSARFKDVRAQQGVHNWRFREDTNGANTNVVLEDCKSEQCRGVSSIEVDAAGHGTSTIHMVLERCLLIRNDRRAARFRGVKQPIIHNSRVEKSDRDDVGGEAAILFTDASDGDPCVGGEITGTEFTGGDSGSPVCDFAIRAENHIAGTDGGSGLSIDNNYFRTYDMRAIDQKSGAEDVVIGPSNTYENLPVKFNNGTRTVIDGWGRNPGDPRAAGQWNGNGREGLQVIDTSNNDKFVYRVGQWRPLDDRVINSGSDTLSAGGTVSVDAGTGSGSDLDVWYNIDGSPNGAVGIDYTIEWDGSNVVVVFEETKGNYATNFVYEIRRAN